MNLFKNIKDLQSSLIPFRNENKTVGFVPTMGALHKGHLSLVKQSIENDDVTVVSIYVNPTQFNDKNDLNNYPRDLDRDCKLLETSGCQIVFAPTDDEMYPKLDNRIFELGQLANIMEGKHRPGHFNGVAQIVTILFDFVQPDVAYFGQKDFQQLAVIRKLVKDYNYPVKIQACPIMREDDGLAMSSRNMLLNNDQRRAAPVIYKTLCEARNMIGRIDLKNICQSVENKINQNHYLKLEYFEVVDSLTLQPVDEIRDKIPLTVCIAVFAGTIRLIDNIDFIS
jgi:pantoate--beta-alanine ligase